MRSLLLLLALFISQIIQGHGFIAGTLVATPQGHVPIEELRVGDEVIACDLNGGCHRRQVIEISQFHVPFYYRLTINDEVIGLSPDDRFYQPIDRQWVQVAALASRHTFFADCCQHLSGTIQLQLVQEPVDLFTLTVDEFHNFCITSQSIVVHNWQWPNWFRWSKEEKEDLACSSGAGLVTAGATVAITVAEGGAISASVCGVGGLFATGGTVTLGAVAWPVTATVGITYVGRKIYRHKQNRRRQRDIEAGSLKVIPQFNSKTKKLEIVDRYVSEIPKPKNGYVSLAELSALDDGKSLRVPPHLRYYLIPEAWEDVARNNSSYHSCQVPQNIVSIEDIEKVFKGKNELEYSALEKYRSAQVEKIRKNLQSAGQKVSACIPANGQVLPVAHCGTSNAPLNLPVAMPAAPQGGSEVMLWGPGNINVEQSLISCGTGAIERVGSEDYLPECGATVTLSQEEGAVKDKTTDELAAQQKKAESKIPRSERRRAADGRRYDKQEVLAAEPANAEVVITFDDGEVIKIHLGQHGLLPEKIRNAGAAAIMEEVKKSDKRAAQKKDKKGHKTLTVENWVAADAYAHSIAIPNSNTRIGCAEGLILELKQTRVGQFHHYPVEWKYVKSIGSKVVRKLIEKGLIDSSGNVLV